MSDTEDQIRELLDVINDSLIEHTKKGGDTNPIMVISALLTLVTYYSDLLGIDSAIVLQQALDSVGGNNKSIGGIGLEFE